MGDHFVLLVDRLLTEATLEAAIESQNCKEKLSSAVDDMEIDLSSPAMKFGKEPSLGKMVECRICQDEDEDSNMESPCSCCGSLKYAHRRCVQKWCNEKGDTICEICHQQFKPGYTAPPRLFQIGHIPMNFRGNWEISRQDITNPHFVAMLSTDNGFVESDHEEYSASSGGGLVCCRSVAIIFMILFVLRHILPFMFSQSYEYSFPLFLLMLVRTVGIVLPIYVILRAAASIHRIRHFDRLDSLTTTGTGDESMQMQTQTHIIHLQ